MLNKLKSLFYNYNEKKAIMEILWDIKTAINILEEFPGSKVMCIILNETFYNSFENKKVKKRIVVGFKYNNENVILQNAFERTGLKFNEHIIEKWKPYSGYDFTVRKFNDG